LVNNTKAKVCGKESGWETQEGGNQWKWTWGWIQIEKLLGSIRWDWNNGACE
jgi:hypothetical protein